MFHLQADPSLPTTGHPVDSRASVQRARRPAAALRTRAIAFLIVGDSLLILMSFGISAALRGTLVSDPRWLFFSGPLLLIYHAVAMNSQGLSKLTLQSWQRAVWKAEQALMLGIALVTIVNFYARAIESFPRLTIAVGSALAFVSIALFRYLLIKNLVAILGGNPFSILLIRDRDAPMVEGPFSRVLIADTIFDPDHHDPVMYDRLASMLSSVDRVVISCREERRRAWAFALRGANIQGEIIVPELEALAPMGLSHNLGMPAIIVATGPLDLSARALKRGFDLAMATAALVAFSPLLAMVAVAIKIDSRGPILFRQVRIGRGNKLFKILKFRSMTDSQSDHAANTLTTRDDERVTAIGRFIRRTSIDELPQLLNVLAGHMSIVGPRPHALGARAADKLYWDVDNRYWGRHAIKPGLTGLAQVRGFRGATDAEDDLRNRLRADLEYIERWSIWRDIGIILATTRVLLHRNAF